MKLAINPKLMLAGIAGLGLVSFSEKANPGYGALGFWIVILGFSIFTVCMTLHHGKGEAHRIRHGAHVGITTIRITILAMLSLAIFREINTDMIILTINQYALFAVVFDPSRNHYHGDSFFYHGGQAWYDKLVRKHPVKFFIAEIVACLTTGLYLILTV